MTIAGFDWRGRCLAVGASLKNKFSKESSQVRARAWAGFGPIKRDPGNRRHTRTLRRPARPGQEVPPAGEGKWGREKPEAFYRLVSPWTRKAGKPPGFQRSLFSKREIEGVFFKTTPIFSFLKTALRTESPLSFIGSVPGPRLLWTGRGTAFAGGPTESASSQDDSIGGDPIRKREGEVPEKTWMRKPTKRGRELQKGSPFV